MFRPVFIVFVGHALAQLKTLFDLQLDPYIPSTGIVWIKHLVVTRPRNYYMKLIPGVKEAAIRRAGSSFSMCLIKY